MSKLFCKLENFVEHRKNGGRSLSGRKCGKNGGE
jgi:hypothetical protein